MSHRVGAPLDGSQVRVSRPTSTDNPRRTTALVLACGQLAHGCTFVDGRDGRRRTWELRRDEMRRDECHARLVSMMGDDNDGNNGTMHNLETSIDAQPRDEHASMLVSTTATSGRRPGPSASRIAAVTSFDVFTASASCLERPG